MGLLQGVCDVIPVLSHRSPILAPKRLLFSVLCSLFSVNALVGVGQESSIRAGLRHSGLQRHYTCKTPVQPANRMWHLRRKRQQDHRKGQARL